MSSIIARNYIEQFRHSLSEGLAQTEQASASPYTASRAISSQDSSYLASLEGYGSSQILSGLTRPRDSVQSARAEIRSRPRRSPVPLQIPRLRAMEAGLLALSGRRQPGTTVPPAMGLRQAVEPRVQRAAARPQRRASRASRLAAVPRRRQSLERMMRASYRTDQDLEGLMEAAIRPGTGGLRGLGPVRMPGLRYQPRIRPGGVLRHELQNVEPLQRQLHREFGRINSDQGRAVRFRRAALRYGPATERGQRFAREAHRLHQSVQLRRDRMEIRARQFPSEYQARVDRYLNSRSWRGLDRRFRSLDRRFGLSS